MIRLKTIEIHINEEFDTQADLNEFKRLLSSDVARHLKTPPTVYNTYETHENKLVINK